MLQRLTNSLNVHDTFWYLRRETPIAVVITQRKKGVEYESISQNTSPIVNAILRNTDLEYVKLFLPGMLDIEYKTFLSIKIGDKFNGPSI